jgi:hypothetical protein
MLGVPMCAKRMFERRSTGSWIEALFTWLGGGEWAELDERHERSTHVPAGVVVLLGAALASVVATLAVAGATRWPMAAIVPLTFVFGVMVGAVSRGIVSGPTRGWPGVVGRAAVATTVGVVVGELAAVVLFSGSIDRRLDDQAARSADSAPAVVQASADLGRTRQARTALDDAVEQARRHRDEALVVARCEFNPSPDCPQTHITGVPGAGPETRTATDFLGNAQRELDNALAERDRRAAGLDSEMAAGEQALAQARETAIADVDGGLGARWVAMNGQTIGSPGAMVLRLLTIGFFALLCVLPLILKLWRGETTHDRSATARAERGRAELQADTAIAVKRAEVRAAVEAMWAEQQLASTRLAVEAQTEIDRERQRRRVIAALDGPVQAQAQRIEASRLAAQLPAGGENADVDTSQNLLARAEPGGKVEPRREGGTPLIPTIPDVTKAAARWIRPFVPPIIASAIDTTTKQLRGARRVVEEVEEIHFTRKRTHTVTVHAEESGERPGPGGSAVTDTTDDPRWIESSTVGADDRDQLDARAEHSSLAPTVTQPALTERDGPREVRGPDGPRQLPPAE